MMFEQSRDLLSVDNFDEVEAANLLKQAGFSDWKAAWRILKRLGRDEKNCLPLIEVLPTFFLRLSSAAGADRVLIYFDRFVSAHTDPAILYQYLTENPRSIEILVTLFSSSQFLSEILLRNPEYLRWLVERKNLYRPKRLEALYQETLNVVQGIQDRSNFGLPQAIDLKLPGYS